MEHLIRLWNDLSDSLAFSLHFLYSLKRRKLKLRNWCILLQILFSWLIVSIISRETTMTKNISLKMIIQTKAKWVSGFSGEGNSSYSIILKTQNSKFRMCNSEIIFKNPMSKYWKALRCCKRAGLKTILFRESNTFSEIFNVIVRL